MKTLDLAIEIMADKPGRKKNGGQIRLAEKLGVSTQVVQNWKRNGVAHHARPAVAKIAGTTVEDGEW